MSTSMRPNRSTAVLTAASASTRLVTSSLTASRSSDCPKACDTRLLSRAVATTACPAAKAAFAKSTPIPRLAPVMNQTLLLLITTPWLSATVPANSACRTRAPLASRSASFDDTGLCLSVRLGIGSDRQTASPQGRFDDATFNRSAASFENPDHVSIVIHTYRWRLGLAEGEATYDTLERRLAVGPGIA